MPTHRMGSALNTLSLGTEGLGVDAHSRRTSGTEERMLNNGSGVGREADLLLKERLEPLFRFIGDVVPLGTDVVGLTSFSFEDATTVHGFPVQDDLLRRGIFEPDD